MMAVESLFLTSSSLFILLLPLLLFQTSLANKPYDCTPSACGIFPNISFPFRLIGHPKQCGYVELACENNVTSLYHNFHKFYVKEINYTHDASYYASYYPYDATMRVVDASINNDICSFPTATYDRDRYYPLYIPYRNDHIYFVSCPHPLKNSSHFTETTPCQTPTSSRFTYIKVDDMRAAEVPETCRVDVVAITSWMGFKDFKNASLEEINTALLYGFEIYIDSLYEGTKWEKFIYQYREKVKLPLFILLAIAVVFGAAISPVMAILGFIVVLAFLLSLFSYQFNSRILWWDTFDPLDIYTGSGFKFAVLDRRSSVRFTKRNEADSPSSPQGSKRLKAAVQGSPVYEQQLAVTVPTVADSRPLTPGPPRRKKLVATTDLAGEGGRPSDPPAQLDGLSLVEGSRRYVEWLGREVRKLEGEKGQSAEQLTAAKAKLKRANAEVKAVKAELAAQVAKTAEEAAEVERLKAELEVAKGQLKATSGRLKATSSQLKAAIGGQGGMLRAYTKRLLLSDHFTGLAGELAGLINGNAVLEALEKVAKDYPGLDASKYGYKRLEGAAEYTQYARVVRRHLGHLPLLDGLASSPELLTAGMVEACPIDREAELDAAFDSLSGEDVEMEEAGAGAEEERAGEEPSSSKAAEGTGVVEEERAEVEPIAVAEGVSAEGQPAPEKEVGDS